MAKTKENRHVLFLWLGSLCSKTIEVFLICAFFLVLQLCGNIRFYDHSLIFDTNTYNTIVKVRKLALLAYFFL